MKKIFYVLILIVPYFLYASDSSITQTDIIQRTVNFIIFISICYYLLAKHVKSYFTQRTQNIRFELEKVQELENEMQLKIKDAQQKIENAKRTATQMIQNAHDDVESINLEIENQAKQEISRINKTSDERISIETRIVKQEIVDDIINNLLQDENIIINQNDLASIIMNKVA